jgi:ATP-binding cassette subfamily C protein/ATP-binding cassette subfamily C protein LapB
MIWIGGSIAYIPAIAIIIAIVFAIFIRSLISRTTTESARADSKRQELLFEMLNLYRFIKTTGVGPPMMNQYEQLSLEANMSNLEMTRMHTLVSTFGQGLSQFSGVCTMIFGVLLVMEGTLDSGTLLATMLITWKILAPVRNIFTVITSVDKTIKSIFQLDRFMNLPQELQPEAATHFSHQFKGDIVFTNVSMKSPAEVQASLMGTSFSVKRGQILQICCHGGVDGAAILDALLRMRDYQSGSISIDAMNIRQFDPITIRRSIAYVPDTIELFETTLLNNLLLAHPTATEDEIHRALDLARLTRELRKLPLGLNTPVDGRDDQFSESFLKRLGFARAWIRPSEINIYQSPDIGLTQSRILELAKNLGNFKSTTTTIVVSNNAELFKKADIGLWLDQGKVKSYGPAAQVSKSFYEAS